MYKANKIELSWLPDLVDSSAAELTPAMDVFSAGCVLIELFTETPPFTFAQLLAYRDGTYEPDLSKIEDPALASMLGHMIQKDPSQVWPFTDFLLPFL